MLRCANQSLNFINSLMMTWETSLQFNRLNYNCIEITTIIALIDEGVKVDVTVWWIREEMCLSITLSRIVLTFKIGIWEIFVLNRNPQRVSAAIFVFLIIVDLIISALEQREMILETTSNRFLLRIPSILYLTTIEYHYKIIGFK